VEKPRVFHLEDYEPGWSSQSPDYLVREEEILEFGRRFDPRPIHTDPEAAARSHFGGLVAPGCLVFCIRSSLAAQLPVQPALVAGLGVEALDLPLPVRPGDRLRLRVECLDRRVSRSRTDRGIVRIRNVMENQRGDSVLTMVSKLMVERR